MTSSVPLHRRNGKVKESRRTSTRAAKTVEEYEKPFCSDNTKVNTRWAVKNFSDWRIEYNNRHAENPCPEGVLLVDDASVLASWLQKYVLATRKKDGEKYPPKTLYLLLCGLQRYMKEKKYAFNIMNRDHPEFKRLFHTCDNYFRELRSEGVGAEEHETEVVSPEEESKLWETGVLSAETPKGLLNAVFFYNGKNFLLRGGAEHRSLKFSQLTRSFNADGSLHFTYTENSSKNRCGGFNQLNVKNKVVHQYQDLRAGDRCHTYLLHLYISKVPEKAIQEDVFYVRPLAKAPCDPFAPWFMSTPIGKNTLGKMLATMYADADISGHKTNHSLRAYGTTQLFRAGIPEKVIQDRSGHRSLEGLRKYERISDKQKQEACKALQWL